MICLTCYYRHMAMTFYGHHSSMHAALTVFPLVPQCTPRPVLLRGGDKGEESEVLKYAQDLINAGASGLVYGRNIIHHEDPRGITRKFMKKVSLSLSLSLSPSLPPLPPLCLTACLSLYDSPSLPPSLSLPLSLSLGFDVSHDAASKHRRSAMPDSAAAGRRRAHTHVIMIRSYLLRRQISRGRRHVVMLDHTQGKHHGGFDAPENMPPAIFIPKFSSMFFPMPSNIPPIVPMAPLSPTPPPPPPAAPRPDST